MGLVEELTEKAPGSVMTWIHGYIAFDFASLVWQSMPMSQAHALPPQPLAPWAEIVPNTPRMTTDDLDALLEDGWQYELVEGVLVRMPLSGGEASSIAMRLGGRLSVYVEDNDLGAITGADGGYRPDPAHPRDTELAPDVAFVRKDRVPDHASPDYPKAWPIAPDLAVEVASPKQYRPGMCAKAKLYLSFGTRLVWVIWPRWQQVDVWWPGDTQPSATLSAGDRLDGLDIVPGFTYPVEKLFA